MRRELITIDCEYVAPRLACAYLMIEGEEALFVENNTSLAVPKLIRALKENNIDPSAVKYAIITHIHLDHAGGSGKLLSECPNATLLAHPKASRHAIDPTRLIASAKMVYGEEKFASLYGEILPVPENRVRIMNDGEEIPFGDRTLKFIYTRGHANHHFCIYDSGTNGVFTGDSFGIAYPDLQRAGQFVFPSSTPTDFAPEEALKSFDLILGTGCDRVYLTHFGELKNVQTAAEQLKGGIVQYQKILEDCRNRTESGDALTEYATGRVKSEFERAARDCGLTLTKADMNFLAMDIDLNAAGISFAAERLRRS